MDSLHCKEWLFFGAASFPLDGCVDSQAVSVGIKRAGGGDGKGGGWVSQGGGASPDVSLGRCETSMAFGFQVGPPVLGLALSGAGCGAGAVAGARTQGSPWSGAWTGTGAYVEPRFRAWDRTDATPWARAGIWAWEPGVNVQIGFVNMIEDWFPWFKGICADLRTSSGVLFHPI